ncbi:MAG: hypothetical protein U1B30_16145, partial [Pseudomonadota bacterium]|nr:hypothetical protein [Pseudomonadota bacterium]
MADSKSEQDKWKFKYLESLEELEKKEGNWRAADQLLRHGLSRIALISHGVDPILDNHLEKLRKALKNSADVDIINEIIEKISSYMKTLDEQRDAGSTLPDPAAVLLQVVQAVNFPLSIVAAVSLLKVRLAKPDAADHLTSLIDEFSRLVALAFYGEQPASESLPLPVAAPEVEQAEEKRSWLQRIFNRDESKKEHQAKSREDKPYLTVPQTLLESYGASVAPAQIDIEQMRKGRAATTDESVEDVFLEILES